MAKKIIIILTLVIVTILCCKVDAEDSLSIGVFGGSISSAPESEVAKKMWKDHLIIKVKITTCGISGMGFSSLTSTEDNIPMQIAREKPFDIYILWASTNDVLFPIGDIETKDSTTQSGGLLKSIL